MKKNIFFSIISLLIFVLLLSGCNNYRYSFYEGNYNSEYTPSSKHFDFFTLIVKKSDKRCDNSVECESSHILFDLDLYGYHNEKRVKIAITNLTSKGSRAYGKNNYLFDFNYDYDDKHYTGQALINISEYGYVIRIRNSHNYHDIGEIINFSKNDMNIELEDTYYANTDTLNINANSLKLFVAKNEVKSTYNIDIGFNNSNILLEMEEIYESEYEKNIKKIKYKYVYDNKIAYLDCCLIFLTYNEHKLYKLFTDDSELFNVSNLFFYEDHNKSFIVGEYANNHVNYNSIRKMDMIVKENDNSDGIQCLYDKKYYTIIIRISFDDNNEYLETNLIKFEPIYSYYINSYKCSYEYSKDNHIYRLDFMLTFSAYSYYLYMNDFDKTIALGRVSINV